MISIGAMIKIFLPKTLLGRSLLIIVSPLILLQIFSVWVFFERHWDTVSVRLARGMAGDIGATMVLVRENQTAEGRRATFAFSRRHFRLRGSIEDGAILTNTTVSGNTAQDLGGGIYNAGTLTVTSSTVSDNYAGGYSGGVHNDRGTININDSTLSGNSTAPGFNFGGAMYNHAGVVTLTDSTVTGSASRRTTTGLARPEPTAIERTKAPSPETFSISSVEPSGVAH